MLIMSIEGFNYEKIKSNLLDKKIMEKIHRLVIRWFL